MEVLLGILINAVCILLLIVVHECGHLLVARWCGVPASKMKMRLLCFPQHIALLSAQGWVSPTDRDAYLTVLDEHLGSGRRLFLFVGGGFFLESIVAMTAFVMAVAAGQQGVAAMIALMSFCLNAVYVVFMDLPLTLRHGQPFGDLSGLWYIAKGPALIVGVSLFASRSVMLWWVFA
jgi:hypothetical protein